MGLGCFEKSTGKLIEFQELATPGTLIKNAKNLGYSEDAIEERAVSESELAALLAVINAPTPEQKKALDLGTSDEKMGRISEDLIDVLVSKGVLAISDFPKAAQDVLQERKDLRK